MEVYNKSETPVFRWILAFVLLLVFGGIVFLAYSGYADYVDEPVRNFMLSLRADWLTLFFKGVTFMAEPITLVVICAVLLVFPKTTLRIGIPLTLATGIGSLIHKGLKLIILRERPDVLMHLVEETGYSLPSGHANAGLIFYVMLIFLIRRALKARKHDEMANLITTIFVILIFLIGVSRVYLGVHYPTDILAGWCLGGILSIIFISIYDAVYPDRYHLGIENDGWVSPDKTTAWKRPVKKSAKNDDE